MALLAFDTAGSGSYPGELHVSLADSRATIVPGLIVVDSVVASDSVVTSGSVVDLNATGGFVAVVLSVV